ncbi:MFS transporter [Parapedobacter pyrenivorans]|uniref:MFS transporter n=1 Tax=Parapedobacter pyrenivorans TaxID=1305674 RepID=A0A917MC79_9SPHI|nr:MFS transporter [Parapedobacter pyrenivorans]GGG88153.1 MFS transporter [Parapedobacter pyrenivorans]
MASIIIKNYRWLIVSLLFVATTINYLDRQIIGLLKPTLEKEFNWSETDFAHIVMAFTAAYAIGLLVFGRLIDKVGTKWGYAISVVVWSVAGMLHAVARGVFGFAAARIGLGIGEAGNFPAAMKAVAEWFPKKERALATGIFNAGTSIGVVTALFMTPWILTHYGWQEVFWITGSLGFVWLMVWWWLYEVPAEQKRLSADELKLIQSGQTMAETETDQKPIKWGRLFSFPQTWAFITGKLLIDPIYWFFLFWLPSYFSSTFSLDLTKPSPELMVIYAATTVGSIAGGYFSSLLVKRGWRTLNARKAALLVFAILETSIILTQFVTDVWIAVALISAAVAVHQAWATNIFTMASDMFPKSTVSSVVGIGGMAGAVGGILFPMLVGYLLDAYKLQGNLSGGYNLLFTICGMTYLVAWAIIHVLTRSASRIDAFDQKFNH